MADKQVKDARKIKAKEMVDIRAGRLIRKEYIARKLSSKGLMMFIIYTVMMSANNYVAKAIFVLNPNLDVWQMTFVRGAVAWLIMMLKINVNAKALLWDSIEMDSIGALIFRCAQGGISLVIAFNSIKYFNVSTVGVVCSLSPPLCMIMAYFVSGETTELKEALMMGIVLTSVFLVIFGAEEEHSEMEPPPLFATIGLLALPILNAGGTIACREMRKMPEELCTTWQ